MDDAGENLWMWSLYAHMHTHTHTHACTHALPKPHIVYSPACMTVYVCLCQDLALFSYLSWHEFVSLCVCVCVCVCVSLRFKCPRYTPQQGHCVHT